MPEEQLRVILLKYTPDPEETIALAGRLCYSRVGVPQLREKLSPEMRERLLKLLLEGGHHSPLEHVNFTFVVEGISRACSHQLVRHRLASYSQQSQRYVSAKDFGYIIPPEIAKDDELRAKFIENMERFAQSYEFYVERLRAKGRTREQAQEDARFILPNAAETKIMMTMNARELIHVSNVRLCERAQWEIRRLFEAIKEEVAKIAPTVASYMVPKCDDKFLGYCPEGEMSCGRVPTRKP